MHLNSSSVIRTDPAHYADVPMWSVAPAVAKPSAMRASKSFVDQVYPFAPFIICRRRRTDETPFDYARSSEPFSENARAAQSPPLRETLDAGTEQGNTGEEETETVHNPESRRHSLGEAGADSTMSIVQKVVIVPNSA
jgi:hypothetical protein